MTYFTDDEIDSMISEEKYFDGSFEELLNLKESDGHKTTSIDFPRADGSKFVIKLRQNQNDINDFSAIFTFQEKGNNKDFKLRRYNGKSHAHTNKIENQDIFFKFHIHMATQRYQDMGLKEESFAEATERYSNLRSALQCLLEDCNINMKSKPQTSLFDN